MSILHRTSCSNFIGQNASITIAASNAPLTVKANADYVCSGTDDDVIINSAIQEVQKHGGGSVCLSCGEFSISNNIEMYGDANDSPLYINGSGNRATTIKKVTSNTSDGITLNITGSQSPIFKGISNLTLDGSKGGNTAGTGIKVYKDGGTGDFYDMILSNVMCYYWNDQGMFFEGAWGLHMDNCITEYCDGTGLEVCSASQAYIGKHFSAYNGGSGFNFGSTGTFFSSTVYSLHAYLNSQRGVEIHNAQKCNFNNIYVKTKSSQTAGYYGVAIRSSTKKNNISNVISEGDSDMSLEHCIYIEGDNNIITGVQAFRSSSNAVVLSSQSSYNIVNGLMYNLGSNASEDILDSGSNNSVVNSKSI